MRRTVIVGNWKANKTIPETEEFLKELPVFSSKWVHEVVITPSFVNLETAARLMPPNVKVGAQDASKWESGEHCGEVTAAMLKAVGVSHCIVGHIERRAMGETNMDVNAKVKNCLAHDITPIFCVGETLDEYNNDMSRVVIEKQIKEGLDGIKDTTKIIIAYQPIWSIGTGHYAPGELANIICDFIRKTVQKMMGSPMAGNFPLLYAGGITASNAREYLECSEIDGLMVGPTSRTPSVLSEIVMTPFTVKKFSEEGTK
jgi:triosephosphate isomerase